MIFKNFIFRSSMVPQKFTGFKLRAAASASEGPASPRRRRHGVAAPTERIVTESSVGRWSV
jgi:hypothetical protein